MFCFFHNEIDDKIFTLSQEESRHCIKILRHREGDLIKVTDGKGTMLTARVISIGRDNCAVQVVEKEFLKTNRSISLHIGIAPTKSSDRMEWFVEKAVEVGIEKISFLQCDHAERKRLDLKRMERVAISAIKQSQTAFLPEIELISLSDFFIKYEEKIAGKYIAWCDSQNNREFANIQSKHKDIILLIGPEGDFSLKEIEQATSHGYISVKMGSRRLRTETAGLYGTIVVAAQQVP